MAGVQTVPAPGRMAVDFEERLDFERLRTHRLQRSRQALESSGPGALLLLDTHNVQYVSGMHLGIWVSGPATR